MSRSIWSYYISTPPSVTHIVHDLHIVLLAELPPYVESFGW